MSTPVSTRLEVPVQLAQAASPPPPDLRDYRLSSIDVMRGLVIVLMAIDHVRDYVMAGGGNDPMADPDVGVGLFLTRWITHFCAPVFVFLAGTSAGLMTARKSPPELGGFLLRRGLWLILVELLVVSTAWTFAPFGLPETGGLVLVPMQVIWAIGASMVVLSAAQFLGRPACAVIGATILLGHNLLDAVWPAGDLFEVGPLWVALHAQVAYSVGPFFLIFLYPLVPWIGVILFGFGVAGVFEIPAARRNALLLGAGTAAVAAFLVLRASQIYGDPNPWEAARGFTRTALDFLNTTKYPPSLVYLLMTLGPAAILCSVADRLPRVVRQPLNTFGRVPFAFYVAHLYLIHSLSVALGVLQGYEARQFFTLMAFFPEGYGFGLGAVYLVWALVVLALYPLCRWVAELKARRRDWWLSYL